MAKNLVVHGVPVVTGDLLGVHIFAMTTNNPKREKLSHAAEVLQGLLQNSNNALSEQFIRWRLWNNWAEVVGADFAKKTMPVGYLNGVLYLWVRNSVWMQELTFLAKPLKEKINQHVKSNFVHSIRFTLDQRAVPRPEQTAEDIRRYIDQGATKKTENFDE